MNPPILEDRTWTPADVWERPIKEISPQWKLGNKFNMKAWTETSTVFLTHLSQHVASKMETSRDTLTENWPVWSGLNCGAE